MLKLGYAQTDITPDTPMLLIGFDRGDNLSRGILKPLLAQVSVWEHEERCCLICIDNIGFTKKLANELRMKAAEVLNVSIHKIMLCFSHCHSAPDADRMTQYFDMVCSKIVLAAKSALSSMKPVLCGWTNVEAEIGVNRREGNSNLDKRVGILKACGDHKDDIRLLIIRVTAHCNVLKRDNYYISPDLFGAIRDVLQEKYGCPVMVIQGSAGNIAPRYFNSVETPIDARGFEYIRSKTALEDMANIIYGKVVPEIGAIEVMSDLPATMYSNYITLNSIVPSMKRAEQIADEAKRYCWIDGTEWLEEIKNLHKAGINQQEDEIEVQYFSIGPWCLCGVPYELMVEFALKPMERLKDEFFYVNGYTNGCLSYFPTEEEFELGGFEVYWALLIYYKRLNRVFPLQKESESKLIDFIVQKKR